MSADATWAPASASTTRNAIADYALIGDCRSAALVSLPGSIDWLCWPGYASPALFGALLDPHGGSFRICPSVPSTPRRRYLPQSNVLETTFDTAEGCVRLLDFMPVPRADGGLQPSRSILRLVEGVRGSVPMKVRVDPRPDYALTRAALADRHAGWTWTWDSHWLSCTGDWSFAPDAQALEAQAVIQAGERRWCALAFATREPGVIPALGDQAQARLDQTLDWWRRWAGRARYEGPYREQVERSALVLKMLTHTLSGAVVAAPTTSLPEWPGAGRNWDYRYCWLRDAALTMRAFTGLGYLDEARAFLDWMLHATRLSWPDLHVLYDVYGRSRIEERELAHWRGFADSRPVRIGNAAHRQLQLDVYGAVCSAGRNYAETTGELRRDEGKLLAGFARSACRRWQEPDNGIWEDRGPRRHYTFSKVMCWTAIDALLGLADRGMVRAPEGFEAARSAIAERIESEGFNRDLDSYVSVFGGDRADASLLLMGCLDYRSASDARMRGTFDFIQRRLGCQGLLYRTERRPGESPEGTFGICSFWAVDNLAKRRDVRAGHAMFERVVRHANDVGLLAEEIDPGSGALLGNFPQGYTHVGLINAALALSQAEAA